MTPELKAYLAALELVASNTTHLLNRLAAMEQSGVLSTVAKDAVNDWVVRVATSIQAVPAKPAEE